MADALNLNSGMDDLRQEDIVELGVLGKGASGTVRKAFHTPSLTMIAIKVCIAVSLSVCALACLLDDALLFCENQPAQVVREVEGRGEIEITKNLVPAQRAFFFFLS